MFKELLFNHANFKGGSGGGGGGSGVVDYPAYMKTVHGDWLDNTGADTLTLSVTAAMEAAHGNSPWSGQAAYDPDAAIAVWEADLAAFAAILAGISDTADWATLYTQSVATIEAVTDVDIDADVVAFGNQLDDELTTRVLPRFRAGMRDINAVVSTAFVIGQGVIEAFRTRDVAKHASGLRLTIASERTRQYLEGTNQMLQLMIQRINWEDSYVKTSIESNRIKIVAKSEENAANLEIDKSDALWDLEAFQYGANLLAGIGGGTAQPQGNKPSTLQSVLGGALSGASAGAMATGGNPIGAVVGGVLGAASGFL